jgi:hypothetical protein
MSSRCPDCGQEHGAPRCLPPKPPACTGSYTAEFAVTLEKFNARPRIWWEPKWYTPNPFRS